MYFQKFPTTFYTLDDKSTVQVVTNITLRNTISDDVKNNLALYEKYDIKEGETPEIVADKFYNNPQYHWLILHVNDILDPRYDWPLSSNDFNKHIEQKYNDINAVHHYEDSAGNSINGNVQLNSNLAFTELYPGNVILNNTNNGTGYIVSKIDASSIIVEITDGGFITGDEVRLSTNSNIRANITSTELITGIAVTNYVYEDAVNESKRKIKVLKSQYLDSLDNEFTSKINA